MIKFNRILILTSTILLSACSSVHVAVDPKSIADNEKFKIDNTECINIAKTYNLTADTVGNAAIGAVAGGAAVAGVATVVAGAVFWPAIPFIIAGTLAGGSLTGGLTGSKESAAREQILSQCLVSRGYQTFTPK